MILTTYNMLVDLASNRISNPLPRKGRAERLDTTSGAVYLYLGYTIDAALCRTQAHQGSIWWVLWFMWFTKKRIYKQIEEYGQDKELLIRLSNFALCESAEDITLEHIQGFYTRFLMPLNSLYLRNEGMKAIRKFFRAVNIRGGYCLPARFIKDNPFDVVDENAILVSMKKEIKRLPGRPVDWKSVKKVLKFREGEDKGEAISFGDIAKAMKRDKAQIYRWYIMGKNTDVDLSTV